MIRSFSDRQPSVLLHPNPPLSPRLQQQDYKDLLPQLKLEYLILILRERIDPPEILHLDSILLRRLFRVSVHNQLKEAGVSLKPFKDELINLLKQPLDLNLKKKIADAAAELDRRLIQSLCKYAVKFTE